MNIEINRNKKDLIIKVTIITILLLIILVLTCLLINSYKKTSNQQVQPIEETSKNLVSLGENKIEEPQESYNLKDILDSNYEYTFQTSTNDIITIDENGTIKAITQSGEATITITSDQGESKDYIVKVEDGKITELREKDINQDSVTNNTDNNQDNNNDNNQNPEENSSSSDNNNNNVETNTNSTFTIKSSITEITLYKEQKYTTLQLELSNKNLKATWSSSNTNYAKVSEAGLVTFYSPGSVTITATVGSNKATITLKGKIDEYDQLCNYIITTSSSKTIDYNDFKTYKSDKFEYLRPSGAKDDDFYSIKAAHECANNNNRNVVIQKSSTFNIYNKANEAPIDVRTSTDLRGSTIYIHDEYLNTISKNAGTSSINSIYEINGDNLNDKTKNAIIGRGYWLNNKSYTGFGNIQDATSTFVNQKFGTKYKKILVRLRDTKTNAFGRKSDSESNNKTFKTEYKIMNCSSGTCKFDTSQTANQYTKVVNGNNVLNFTTTDIVIFPIYNEQLSFSNATFITKASKTFPAEAAKYVTRNIKVFRSNTKLSGITHEVETASTGKITYPYEGFIYINEAADITLDTINIVALNHTTSNGTYHSTYDLQLYGAVNVTMNKIIETNNQLVIDNYKGRYDDTAYLWGSMASNFCRNVTITNSTLSVVDAHRGIDNLTIKNSSIGPWGILVVGRGNMIISNTIINSDYAVNLRDDYGAYWKGTITITKSTFIPNDKDTSVSQTTPSLIHVNNNSNLSQYKVNYLSDIYWPKLTVSGLTIKGTQTTINVFPVKDYNTAKSFASTYLATTENTYKLIMQANNSTNYNIQNVKNDDGKTVTTNYIYNVGIVKSS